MKIFCTYAFTDENTESVTKRMRSVVDALEGQGFEVYCDRFDDELKEAHKTKDVKTIFNKAFKELNSSDLVVAIITSPKRSVGQLMEIGAAYNQNIPIYMFEHVSALNSSYLPDLVTKKFTWIDINSLESQLETLNAKEVYSKNN